MHARLAPQIVTNARRAISGHALGDLAIRIIEIAEQYGALPIFLARFHAMRRLPNVNALNAQIASFHSALTTWIFLLLSLVQRVMH